MKDKEEQFKLADKTLVKTFEPMTRDTTLFNRALERIIKGRLSANYIAESALSFEEEFKSYHKDIRDFVRQVLRVVDMIKVENLNFRRIYTKSQKDPHERVRLFYQLFKPLFEKYTNYCINKSYLDYNDMLIRAISLLKNQTDIRDKFRNTFRHILVDEFQDVNNLQVEFLNTLLTPSTKLFCVGDDWQSIYGFRGSEVDYIINFERYFDNPQIIQLDMNYRSHDSIVNASNEVIRNNKYMIDKEIRASKKAEGKINIYLAENEDDGVDFFVCEVNQLLSNGYSGEEILVLYRRSKMFAPYKKRLEEESLKVTGRTIHASKGLEAKVVFIIGLTEGYGGFPDIWLDDRIFQVIKKAKHDLMMEEERRLFYVALTRARNELYLISEKGNESSFLSEIPDEYAISYKHKPISLVDDISLCPKCNLQIEGHYTFCPFCGYKLT
jgi:DNA helicase IV